MKPKLLCCFLALTFVQAVSAQSPLLNRLDRDSALYQISSLRRDRDAGAVIERGLTGGGIWRFNVEGSANYESNAFRAPHAQDDWHVDYGASLGYDWWLAEGNLTVSPEVGIGGQRYDSYSDLSGDQFSAGVRIEPKLPFRATLSYATEWEYDAGFKQHTSTVQNLGLAVGPNATKFANDMGVWSTTLSGNYTFADISLREAVTIALGTKLSYSLMDELAATATAGISYRDYTHNAGTDRHFWIASVGAQLAYSITKEFTLTTGVNYARSDGNLPTFDYDGFTAYIGLSYSWESKPASSSGYHESSGKKPFKPNK